MEVSNLSEVTGTILTYWKGFELVLNSWVSFLVQKDSEVKQRTGMRYQKPLILKGGASKLSFIKVIQRDWKA